MASKYYAVLVGKTKGVFTNWDECKKQIHGYPGALYKSFLTLREAEQYLTQGQPQKNATKLCRKTLMKFMLMEVIKIVGIAGVLL